MKQRSDLFCIRQETVKHIFSLSTSHRAWGRLIKKRNVFQGYYSFVVDLYEGLGEEICRNQLSSYEIIAYVCFLEYDTVRVSWTASKWHRKVFGNVTIRFMFKAMKDLEFSGPFPQAAVACLHLECIHIILREQRAESINHTF